MARFAFLLLGFQNLFPAIGANTLLAVWAKPMNILICASMAEWVFFLAIAFVRDVLFCLTVGLIEEFTAHADVLIIPVLPRCIPPLIKRFDFANRVVLVLVFLRYFK